MRRLFILSLFVLAMPRLVLGNESSSCDLVDNKGYQDLFASVEALGRELNNQANCQGTADLKAILIAQEQLRTSATHLQTFWKDPSAATQDPSAFSGNLATAIQSVNSIGESLSNSSFMKSQCGQQVLSSGKVLLALNDVVSNLAPLAVLAGTFTSALSAAIPYVLGVVGVASVLKILTGMQQQNSIDMNKYEHRQLVLRTTCEYSKVHHRLRYLNLMQTGQMAAVRTELSLKNQALEKTLEQNIRIQKAVSKVEAEINQAQAHSRQLRQDLVRFRNLDARLENTSTDQFGRCALGKVIARTTETQFPTGLAERLSSMTAGSVSQDLELTLQTLQELDNDARISLKPGAPAMLPKDCAELTYGWIKAIGQALAQTDAIVSTQIAVIEKQLSASPDYAKWRKQMTQVESDLVLLKKMIEFMQASTGPNAAISRSELDQRMRVIRESLFGRNRSWSLKESPVESWLEHSIALYEDSTQSFVEGYKHLNSEASASLLPKGPKATPLPQGLENLTAVSLENFSFKSSGWEVVCGKLDNLWLDWMRSKDHLNATKTFCQAIQPLLGDDIDRTITATCTGERRLNERLSTISRIEALERESERQQLKDRAILVQKKRNELRCTPPPLM